MNAWWIAVLLLAQAKPQNYTPGNVLHPGGVPPQAPANAPIARMGGYGQNVGPNRGQGHTRGGPVRSVIVPVFIGGVAEPAVAQATNPEGLPAPSVLVNPEFQAPRASNPVVQDYSNVGLLESPPLEQRQSEPPPAALQQAERGATIHLIALNNGTIVAALGYWLDGDTLNYITRDGNRNRISIDLVDREFSVKLNAERNLEFKL